MQMTEIGKLTLENKIVGRVLRKASKMSKDDAKMTKVAVAEEMKAANAEERKWRRQKEIWRHANGGNDSDNEELDSDEYDDERIHDEPIPQRERGKRMRKAKDFSDYHMDSENDDELSSPVIEPKSKGKKAKQSAPKSMVKRKSRGDSDDFDYDDQFSESVRPPKKSLTNIDLGNVKTGNNLAVLRKIPKIKKKKSKTETFDNFVYRSSN
jgi:hypothetical protein